MKKDEKGSMLIIALITILILSFIVAAGIRTTSTELFTTYNVYLKKYSYYYAVAGVEEIAEKIKNSENPSSIRENKIKNTENGLKVRIFTGDLESGVTNISLFQGFPPPPLPGINLSSSSSITPLIWQLNVTSEIISKKRKAYSEIKTGIYSLMLGY